MKRKLGGDITQTPPKPTSRLREPACAGPKPPKIVRKKSEKLEPLEGVDKRGLTDLDRRYLKTIIEFYNGGPVGIEAIAATLQEETDTLVDVIEPYLLKIGMVTRTSSGRKASETAYRHLGFKVQKDLFSL